jgi:hypothetical protein
MSATQIYSCIYVMEHRHNCNTLYICTFTINVQTPWSLVRKRTIPTDRPPLVDEIWCQLFRIEECRVVAAADPLRSLISVF